MGLTVSRNLNQFPDGSASAPGLAFSSNPATGFYINATYIYASINGTNRLQITNTGVGAGTFFPNVSGNALNLQGRIADSAATCIKLKSLTTLTTAGANIAAFYPDDGTTIAFYVTKDGYPGWPGSNSQATVGAAGGAAALPATPTGYAKVDVNGTTYVMPYYAQS